MADRSLEEYQREMSARISREIREQCGAQEQRAQVVFEEKYQQAHAHLVAIMRQLDPVYSDACEKACRSLEGFNDGDLAFLIHLRLKQNSSQAGRDGLEMEIKRLRRELLQASEQGALLEQHNRSLDERISLLQEEISDLSTRLGSAAEPLLDLPTPGVDYFAAAPRAVGAAVAAWIREWKRTDEYGPATAVIRFMGETGNALHGAITRGFAQGMTVNSAQALLDELTRAVDGVRPALIERFSVVDDAAADPADDARVILHLTEDGVAVYRDLTGKMPLPNQYDHLIHSNVPAEEAVLVLHAAAFLEEAGYGIEALASEVPLKDGSRVGVDILGREPSTVGMIFVQVEGGSGGGAEDRRKKWVQIREVSGGSLYVICDTLACQRVVQNEINVSLRGLRFSSYLTNLESLRSGKRSESGKIWLSGKQSSYLERLPY